MSKIISLWILGVLVIGCLVIVPEGVESAEITSSWSYPVGVSFVMDASLDGEYVAIGDTDGFIRMFHSSSNVPLWTTSTANPIQSISVSEDGSYIAYAAGGAVALVNRYGAPIGSYSPFSKTPLRVAISDDGSQTIYGIGGAELNYYQFFGYVGNEADARNRWYGQTSMGSPEVVISGNGAIGIAYSPSSDKVDKFKVRDYVFSIWTNDLLQPKLGTLTAGVLVNDVDVDYSGATIVVGTETSFGIMKYSTWAMQINTPSAVTDVAVSRDGNIISALTSTGSLYCVKDGVTQTLSTTNTNLEMSGNGNIIICSDSVSINVYDTDLNLITTYAGYGFMDGEQFLQVGMDGHDIYGRSGSTLYHLEAIPTGNLLYTVEYNMGGYDHVNSTTEFTIEGDGVAEYSQIYYEIDGKGWVGYSGTFNMTGLIEGPHTIGFYIVDANGYYTVPTYVEVWLDPYGIFDEIEARLNMLEWSVTDIWTHMDTVNATLTTLQNDIASLNSDMVNVTNAITHIQENVTGLWENNTLNQDDILTLFAYYGLLDQNITGLWENNTLNQDDILTLFAYYGLLDQNVTGLWENNTLNQDDILTLFAYYGLLDQNITGLWENNTLNQAGITTLQQDVQGIQNDITNITGDTTSLFQNITAVVERITILETNGTLTTENITTILTGMGNLNTALGTVNSNIGALTTSVSMLESNQTLTRQSLDDVRANVTSLDISLADAEAVVDQINTDLDAMGSTVDGLNDEIEDTTTTVSGFNGSLIGAYALATVGMILGIIGFALGLMSFRRKNSHGDEPIKPKEDNKP